MNRCGSRLVKTAERARPAGEEVMQDEADSRLPGSLKLSRPLVLVGMMGAGKSTIGRRLAKRLSVPFVDADREIEKAAGMPIPDIFETLGEEAFRDGERRVILRLLSEEGVRVIALGGGALQSQEVRTAIRERAIAIWLDAPLDILVERTSRRRSRPLLERGDKRAILARLLAERRPYYAQAPIHIESDNGPHATVIDRILAALRAYHGGAR